MRKLAYTLILLISAAIGANVVAQDNVTIDDHGIYLNGFRLDTIYSEIYGQKPDPHIAKYYINGHEVNAYAFSHSNERRDSMSLTYTADTLYVRAFTLNHR